MAMRKEQFPIDDDSKSDLQTYIERFPCVCCRGLSVMVDALGQHWCEQCQHRGTLMSLSVRHAWPVIPTGPNTLIGGQWQWRSVVMLGDEAMIARLLRAMQRYDEQWHEKAMQGALWESEGE